MRKMRCLRRCLFLYVIVSSIALLYFLLPSTLPFFSRSAALNPTLNTSVLKYVNPKIGSYGITPNGNGGMIPAVSPPFGMTRWTPQTRENFISQCPYNDMDQFIHGFQATHQPAIWMGENGQVVLVPGLGEVKPLFEERAHRFLKSHERSEVGIYKVVMDAKAEKAGANLTESLYSPVPGGAQPVPGEVREGANGRTRRDVGLSASSEEDEVPRRSSELQHPYQMGSLTKSTITTSLSATAHVGHIRFDFPIGTDTEDAPYVFLQATRQNWTGHVSIDPVRREISGNNPQRQDYALGPSRAPGFSGYFVSRFSLPFASNGISHGAVQSPDMFKGEGEHLGAWVRFDAGTRRVEVRTGVSFISIEQARRNLDLEIPDGDSFEHTVAGLEQAWLEKLGRVTIEGVNITNADHDQRTVWYTGLYHALQYPADFSEPIERVTGGLRRWYSGYTDSIHEAEDEYYQSWSIWDTFRAEHSLLTLFAPERVNGMMRSLLRIHDWSGRLPMWANIIETNIMIGTHVDAVFANALERGFKQFDVAKAWAAVWKNAFVPPENDTELLQYDREAYMPDEVRAGLTSYLESGYVYNDQWAESGSRTLDYAFDDFAASVVATHAGDAANSKLLLRRSGNYDKIYNKESGFMEARNANGTWAGSGQGWTEGDDWIYTFNVMHDVAGMTSLFGGREALKQKLDTYFHGGHNDHTNEPSHHAPYLYAAAGYPSSTQTLVREIAAEDYNATSAGLSGNEDLGQMSAWYVFTALGFYPVNPASDEYVVGAPFFEKVRINLPAGVVSGGVGGRDRVLEIHAPGAPLKPFVKSLKVDGVDVSKPVLKHAQIVRAKKIEFEMADTPQTWGSCGI